MEGYFRIRDVIIAIDTQFAAVAEPIVLGGLLVGLVWVTWHDLKSRRIPNVATYTMVLAGLIWGGICNFFPHPIVASHSFPEALAGCSSCFAVMFAIYSFTNSGAGDVKLAAGVGSFLGVKGGLLTICYAYISAACFAGCLLIWLFGFGYAIRGLLRFMRIWATPEEPEIEVKAKAIMSRGLPLAPFFLIGTVLTLVDLLRFFPAR